MSAILLASPAVADLGPPGPRVFCVIPAYNEERNIGRLLSSLGERRWRGRPLYAVVVDDGSIDQTVAIASGHENVEVVRQPRNLGCREAFIAGFRRALQLAGDDDIVVTMEADNTSDLAVLAAMLRKVEGGAGVVLASCYAPGGRVENTTLARTFLSACANLLLRVCFPIQGVRTYSSFYRAFSVPILRRAFAVYGGRLMEDCHFVSVVGMLVKLSRLPGLRIEEVPLVLRCDRREGASKMRVVRTVVGYCRLILREVTAQRHRPLLALPTTRAQTPAVVPARGVGAPSCQAPPGSPPLPRGRGIEQA